VISASNFTDTSQETHISAQKAVTNHIQVIRNGKVIYATRYMQDAVNHSQDGDTLNVGPGNYNRPIVEKRIKIVSTSLHQATVKGFTIKTPSAFNGTNYLQIYGFIISDPNSEGINANDVDGCKIVKNNIQNNKNTALFMHNVKNCILVDNIIQRNEMGLNLWMSSQNVVSKNNFLYNKSFGIMMDNSQNQIVQNYILGNDTGINCSGVKNTLSKNVISSNTFCGVQLSGKSHLVNGNTIKNNKDVGIRSENSSSNQILDNLITGNKLGGIYLRFKSAGNTIKENDIYKNNSYGIRVDEQSNYTIIANNQITYNNIPIPGTLPSGINLFTSHNQVTNNIVEHNRFGIAYKYSNNTFRNNTVRYNPMGNIVRLNV
jgi:parallel beta-helix repeat protein